jgi:hypothetical protein
MRAQPAAALPAEIANAPHFIASLSAYAVDLVLRRKERQAARARLVAAEYLLDLAERRLFRQLGYSSVMHYGTQALGLAPREVWERLRMARALKALPRVVGAIRRGQLSWSKARELVRVATPETEAAWLERAERLSCRELEAAAAAETPAEAQPASLSRYSCRFLAANTVRVTVDLTSEQFALLDQALVAIRQRLGTEDTADALELITRAYLARVGEEVPALRQHIVVHRCRACRTEWRETSKGSIPAGASATAPTDLIEVDDPEEQENPEEQNEENQGRVKKKVEETATAEVATAAAAAEEVKKAEEMKKEQAAENGPLDESRGTSHVETLRSRYVPRAVLRNVRWRDEGRCQVPGCLNGRWSQLHHIRFFSRGGGQRTRNLLTLCTQHHRQIHDGHLVLRAGDAEGHRFTDRRGRGL